MRTVHIRFANKNNFSAEVQDGPGGGFICVLRNKCGLELFLVDAVVRRRVLTGVSIVDTWGSIDKWYTDKDSSSKPLWR